MIERLGELVPRIAASAWVHPTATVIGDVEIGESSSVWPGAVLRGDFAPIRVGSFTSVQDRVVIHGARTGTFVGDRCLIGHGAFLEDASVADECLVGVGALVLNGARLARGAVAAAGAVLAGAIEVPTGFRAQGVPAKLVASDRPGRDYIVGGAERYAAMAERYRRESAPAARAAPALPALLRELASGPNTAYLATVMPDGSPQVTPVWIDVRGDELLVNTLVTSLKYRNIQRDPRVAISIPYAPDPLRKVDIRGRVVGVIEGAEAHEHILALYASYLGLDHNPWAVPGERRAILRIVPVRIAEAQFDPDNPRGA